jgi:outer membrane protein assembly factor BamB
MTRARGTPYSRFPNNPHRETVMAHAHAPLLYVGIRHHVLALDAATGTEVWRADLPSGLGSDFVMLHHDGARLYAASAGEVVCLDAATGELRWHNPLKGMGTGLTSFATAAGGRADGPASLFEEKRRLDAAASAAT